MEGDKRVHELVMAHRTRTELAKRCVALEELLKDTYKIMKTMDEEWSAMPDYETVEEAEEDWDFTAQNAPDLLASMTALGIEA